MIPIFINKFLLGLKIYSFSILYVRCKLFVWLLLWCGINLLSDITPATAQSVEITPFLEHRIGGKLQGGELAIAGDGQEADPLAYVP